MNLKLESIRIKLVKNPEKGDHFVCKATPNSNFMRYRIRTLMATTIPIELRRFFDRFEGSSLVVKGAYQQLSTKTVEKTIRLFFKAISSLGLSQIREREFYVALIRYEIALARNDIYLAIET